MEISADQLSDSPAPWLVLAQEQLEHSSSCRERNVLTYFMSVSV